MVRGACRERVASRLPLAASEVDRCKGSSNTFRLKNLMLLPAEAYLRDAKSKGNRCNRRRMAEK